MLSETYDIDEFIDKIKDKDRLDIIYTIEEEIEESEKHSRIRELSEKKLRYIAELLGLQYFIKTGMKPKLLNKNIFLKFKTVSENLIKKDQFKKGIRDLFKV